MTLAFDDDESSHSRAIRTSSLRRRRDHQPKRADPCRRDLHRTNRREVRPLVPPAIGAVSLKVDVEFLEVIVEPLSCFEVDPKQLSELQCLGPRITNKDLRCYGTGLGWEVVADRPGLPKGTDAGEASPDPAALSGRILTVINWPTG
jgi:hypothetical protein